MKFNLIGFNFPHSSTWHPKKTCPWHHVTLIPKQNDKGEYETGFLQCPQCGSSFAEHTNEAPTEDTLDLKYKKTKPQIITAKRRKKKHYDQQGNVINDETLIQDIKQGKTVIYYNEQKTGENKPHIVHK
jgi:DNA-directed RNA polymerase subunit M/transcription elongation factor TFIIS